MLQLRLVVRRLVAALFAATVLLPIGLARADDVAADGKDSAKVAWQAGSAAVTITPENLMWMSGYAGRDKPADGKITELWAKALVLQNSPENRAVLVTLDLVGIGRELSDSIAARLEEKYGFARRNVAFCTSHTHTGPVVKKNLSPLHYLQLDEEQRKLVEQYATTLEEKVVEVVGQAIERVKPSELSWGSGKATFAVNRRNNRPEGDVPHLRLTGNLAGPFDHDVPVLAVRNQAGELKTIVFGYACHSTVLGLYQWSGDYPGFAQIELERNHPGCVAMFWAGCGGDQNPLPRRTIELARHYGQRLAAAVDTVLMTTEMTPVTGGLRTGYETVDVALDRLPTVDELKANATSTNRYESARAKMLLAKIDAGETLSPSYAYPIGLWRIGDDVQFILLGGEVVVDYALRLKAELAGEKTWVAGYANDVMAYIPSRRVLIEGGYEGGGSMVYYGLPTIWGPEVEETIIAAVHRLISK
ncbi:MAG: neutral/alkaline non-lysosomal ceramidase N-terminal domain-containing protein [Planctomycetales bacterium]|nr:neutral/alkaline non-lysosomal ceramidase N-terminal domain-containing protein [Planctomycetales bacterium]